MAGIKYYIGKEQAARLQAEADRLGIEVELLIKVKLESVSDREALENLQKAIANLGDRVQNCELILKRYCVISEAQLLDLGFLRGAIEVQARNNKQAKDRGKEKEQQRLELSKKVRQEIEQYLL